MTETSTFQQAIEVVEALSLDDQIVLLNLLQRRLQQRRRSQILQEVEDVRRDYAATCSMAPLRISYRS